MSSKYLFFNRLMVFLKIIKKHEKKLIYLFFNNYMDYGKRI